MALLAEMEVATETGLKLARNQGFSLRCHAQNRANLADSTTGMIVVRQAVSVWCRREKENREDASVCLLRRWGKGKS